MGFSKDWSVFQIESLIQFQGKLTNRRKNSIVYDETILTWSLKQAFPMKNEHFRIKF